MAKGPIDWTRLAGRSLQTTTGARFTVVRVTARAVTVRPQKGSREYSLSIPNELDRAVAAYRKGYFFPSAADLQHAGFSAILSSYTWAVLRDVMIAEIQENSKRVAFQEEDLVGVWRITSLEIGDDYVSEGDEPPSISFDRMKYGPCWVGTISACRVESWRGSCGSLAANRYYSLTSPARTKSTRSMARVGHG